MFYLENYELIVCHNEEDINNFFENNNKENYICKIYSKSSKRIKVRGIKRVIDGYVVKEPDSDYITKEFLSKKINEKDTLEIVLIKKE